jgi:hypothetical protein
MLFLPIFFVHTLPLLFLPKTFDTSTPVVVEQFFATIDARCYSCTKVTIALTIVKKLLCAFASFGFPFFVATFLLREEQKDAANFT